MKVKQLIKLLENYSDKNPEVVMYTPCGPCEVENVCLNSCNQLVLDNKHCCNSITDCNKSDPMNFVRLLESAHKATQGSTMVFK